MAMDIVYEAAKLIQVQAAATSPALGIDLVTEKPLLAQRDHLTEGDYEAALSKVIGGPKTSD